jgi:basic amino acid/polyamine antiporter, APA family
MDSVRGKPKTAICSRGPASGLLRELRPQDGIAIVAGTVIGSGVFLVPGGVAKQLNSLGPVILVWVVGGALSVFGALALGELGAAFPGAGGLYVYLRHAYGKLAGFLYAWGLLTLIHSGSIATLGVAFSLYLSRVLPMSPVAQKAAAAISILFFTVVNCFGLRSGKLVQNIFSACKLGGLALMTVLLFLRGHGQLLRQSFWPPASAHVAWLPFGIALVAVLWAYEGWHVVSFTAGEFKSPTRDLPRSLLYGTLIVAVAYLMANIGYYSVLTSAELRQTDRAAATAVAAAYGPAAVVIVSVLIIVSILGATNGMVLTGPRVYYAMAKDGLFFEAFAKTNPRSRTPVLAILVQGIWSSLLTLMGSFQELFTYVISTAWIFYGLTVMGVVVLRFRQPGLERPYRVPAYPWIPMIFVAAALGITLSAILQNPRHAAFGIGLILIGFPVYGLFHLTRRAEPKSAENTAPTS